ncbi:MAG TPA: O-acetyl-ADP-ribose deacetylase [Planctomycetes bacterium]|nr:O-acetyl-ADP-ribose deacetylase [Planctomycetota bacterium]HIN81277.1 O-acetyl-ADP-ribose deacetylase [Planctomycetota bacterium]
MTNADRIELFLGDITTLAVDAIVNAASEALLGGGGVDGAIHAAAGPGLLEECRALGGCPTGESRITSGHDLRAKAVIHTVGPIWRGGDGGEAQLLRSCYRRSMAIAGERRLDSLAFCAISTGVFGYPREEAALIAIDEVSTCLENSRHPHKVIFSCFDADRLALYQRLLEERESS